MIEYEVCDTCKGNHYEKDKDGNYHLCSACDGVEKVKEHSPQDNCISEGQPG